MADTAHGTNWYGDSPYQSFSTFAGNPYFIDLDQLIEEGLLRDSECRDPDYGDNPRYTDYEKYIFHGFLSYVKHIAVAIVKMMNSFLNFKRKR